AHEHGDEHRDELREYCLQALESLVRRCPKEITCHIPSIISICLDFISYDPNYNYYDDDEADEGMETDGEEAEDSDGEAEEEYSDDDDISWKVRRASAKCLEAVIATRHDMLSDLYRTIAPHLVARFKEREENVKVDIFNAYVALLRQTRSTGPRGEESNAGPVQLLRQQVPSLVKSLTKQLRKEKKSIKTRQGSFHLLTELSLVVPGSLSDHISALIPAIQNSFSEKEKNTSSNMKIDTLSFLQCLISNHPVTVFHPHVPVLVPAVVQAVYDPFYKISSEALNVLQLLLRVLRPFDGQPNAFNFSPYVPEIYQCTLVKLKATDIDQEVKERAISCMGQIISVLGDHLREELQACLPIFLDRLRNEITRLTTVKALTQIAGSPLKIPLDMILCDAVAILASFLRKNQRALKLSTLTLLDTLFKHYPQSLGSSMVNCIMKELRALISEADLHISQLTLHLLTSVAQVHRQSLMTVTKEILPEILVLVKSPLLQGAALNAMLEFFKTLSYSNVDGVGFRQLLLLLTGLVYQQSQTNQPIHKNAYHSIAKCVAALTVANLTNPEACQVVPQFLKEIASNSTTDSVHQFALLAIGEIGKHIDLSGIPELKVVLLSAFESSSEEVKTAASFALGSVAVGNLQEYLPFILSEVDDHPKKQYLLLHALKETISCQSGNAAAVHALQPYIEAIWMMLMKHCECEEEGTRNVVAECFGKLTLVDHETLLPRLAASLNSPSAFARSTVVTAMKFTISDQPQPIDALLKDDIGRFFQALKDSDLNVRRVALVAFNSAAHNKPALVRDLLPQVMPQLYTETKVRNELIREVEMGPFKHTVDDGLDLRKAAFECMYTLLDSCMDRIDIFEFLTHVEEGLKDHYDIKMLTYLMLVRLSSICPLALLQRMDTVIEALKVPCNAKLKTFPVKQELEKQEELKRSALRAFAALQQIPDADKNPQVAEFTNQIKNTPDLQAIFDGIQKDSTQAIGFLHDSSVEENMVY
ncbi:cullin-associated NEDD8-dissociated protein 1-like, partial [Tropilaelaps mercedesae]